MAVHHPYQRTRTLTERDALLHDNAAQPTNNQAARRGQCVEEHTPRRARTRRYAYLCRRVAARVSITRASSMRKHSRRYRHTTAVALPPYNWLCSHSPVLAYRLPRFCYALCGCYNCAPAPCSSYVCGSCACKHQLTRFIFACLPTTTTIPTTPRTRTARITVHIRPYDASSYAVAFTVAFSIEQRPLAFYEHLYHANALSNVHVPPLPVFPHI